MKENTKTRLVTQDTHDTNADINQASKIGLGIVVALAGLIGAWSVACLAGALSTAGIGGVVSGFMTAITGI